MNRVQEQRITWDLLDSVVTEGHFEEDVLPSPKDEKDTRVFQSGGMRTKTPGSI